MAADFRRTLANSGRVPPTIYDKAHRAPVDPARFFLNYTFDAGRNTGPQPSVPRIMSRAYTNSLGGNVPHVVNDAAHRSDDAAVHTAETVVAEAARTAERYAARAMENAVVRAGVQAVKSPEGKNAAKKTANNIGHWFWGVLGAGGLGILWRKMRP